MSLSQSVVIAQEPEHARAARELAGLFHRRLK
jgi:hypothetical protein